jgi:hypothetical protein
MSANTIRVSDNDRGRVADRIAAAAAEGRLTIDEADERTAAAYQARYESELDALVDDLPAPPPPTRPDRRRAAIALFVAIAALLTTAWWHSGAHFFWPVIPLAFIAFRFGFIPWARRPWTHYSR